MNPVRHVALSVFFVFGLVILAGVPVLAGSHSWAPWEFYSNADGTIQYIVLWNPTASGETGIAARDIRSNANISGPHGTNLPAGSTADKFLLGASAGFAALPGAPTPDFPILVDNFFNSGGDSVRFWTYGFNWSSFTFGAGDLPIGGNQALRRDAYTATTGSVVRGTPINFNGATFAPPGVADSLTVNKVAGISDGSRLVLDWDDGSCFGAAEFQIIHGFGSGLPSSLGGTYGIQPANLLTQCNIATSPETWVSVPDPSSDPSRLLWFLVLANDSVSTEGSWGSDATGGERTGPGLGGASTQCGSMNKSLANTCGQ